MAINNSDTSLFRIEALAQNSTRLEGSVVLPQRVIVVVGSAAAALAVSTIALALCFGDYAARQTVSGYLAPESGLVKVMPARPGFVLSLGTKDGDYVERGQTLATISVEQLLEGGGAQSLMLQELEEQERRLAEALRRQEGLNQSAQLRLSSRLSGLVGEKKNVQAEGSALERQKASSEAVLDRMRTLRERGYITEAEFAAKSEQVLALEREWHALRRREAELSTSIKDLNFQLRQFPVEAEQALGVIRNQLSEVRREQASSEADRSYAVIAPVSGQVTAMQMEIGRPVDPAQPLLAIMDSDTALDAHLLVPSRSIGFVAFGQEVRLRYAAYPYQRYGVYSAHVKSISQTALRPGEWAVPLAIAEPMYRVTATLDTQTVRAKGKDVALKVGILLEADIVQEHRPLWAWLLEPLFALKGRV